MANYSYKAVDQLGEVLEGHLDAPNESDVIRQIQDSGLVLVSAEPVKASGLSRLLSIKLLSSRRDLSRRNVTAITRELATLLGAGIELEKALEILSTLTRKNDARRILSRILDDVRSGSTLADALASHDGTFSRLYISLVRAGETGGALLTVFSRLSDFLEQAQKARDEIRSALIYPVILLLSAVASVILLVGFVLPQFRPIFSGANEKLPVMTQIVMTAGEFIEGYWWLCVVITCAVILLARALGRNPAVRERWDAGLLRIPLAGPIFSKADTARLTRTLGTLLGNGVPMVSAFEIARHTVTNYAYNMRLAGVLDGVKAGKRLSSEFESLSFFPALGLHLIHVGEESGQLAPMLMKTAEIYDEEIQRFVHRFLAILTPAVTLILGIVIGGIIVSILMAILSINELAL